MPNEPPRSWSTSANVRCSGPATEFTANPGEDIGDRGVTCVDPVTGELVGDRDRSEPMPQRRDAQVAGASGEIEPYCFRWGRHGA
jgi:hypothetical protein